MFDKSDRWSGPGPFAILRKSGQAGRDVRDKTLLVISAKGFCSALTASIEREFRFLRVQVVSELSKAFTPLITNVALIVVERDALTPLAYHHDDLTAWHRAPIAVLAESDRQIDDSLAFLVEQKVVRGVIGLTAKLDIILAICRILLNGGEYAPPALFQKAVNAKSRKTKRLERSGARQTLTGREWQILAHVAKGGQNRVIASQMGLSEHTVKIHIHNIIRKLGVHNRTEAAAHYFHANSRLSKPQDGR